MQQYRWLNVVVKTTAERLPAGHSCRGTSSRRWKTKDLSESAGAGVINELDVPLSGTYTHPDDARPTDFSHNWKRSPYPR
jgi:hypothetical protein